MPITVVNKDGGGTKLPAPTTSTAKPPTTTASSPPPTVYWFQGRAYTSQAAYVSAVNAAKAAAAAASAAAKKQAALAAAAKKAAADQAKQAAANAAFRKQAALAAGQRAAAQRAKELAEARAKQQAIADRIALQRRAESSRAMLDAARGGKRRVAPGFDPREAAQRAEQARLAAARTTAYDNLQRAVKNVMSRATRGVVNMDRPQRPTTMTPVQVRNQQLVRGAEVSGDWSAVLAELKRQSDSTNGRHVDIRLLDEVEKKYVAPMQEIHDEFAELVAEINQAERSGDDDHLLELVEDPENIALYEQYVRLFGDGTTPGAFTEHQQILAAISLKREQAWAVTLSAGPRASRKDVDELYERIDRESVQRKPVLPGRRMIDDQYQDLEFTKQVLDPDTGKMKKVSLRGREAWLARESEREKQRILGKQRDSASQQDALRRLAKVEDMTFLGYTEEGERVLQDNSLVRIGEQLREWLPEWRLNSAGLPARIAAASNNRPLQEQLIREFMNDAAEAYDKNNDGLLAQLEAGARNRYAATPTTGPIGTRWSTTGVWRQQAAANFSKAKTAWLEQIAWQLGHSSWGSLEQESATGIGALANAALTGFSVIPALVRDRLQKDFGDWQPYIDFTLNTNEGAGQSGLTLGRTHDPNAAEARRNLATAGQTGDAWQDLGIWSSVIRDNAAWGSGNLGGLFTQLTDPFMFSGPGRFTNAGALAIARAGGLKGLKGIGLTGFRNLASEFVRYSSPRLEVAGRTVLGGAGRDAVKIEMARLRLGQKFGIGPEALKMTDDEFKELVERAAANDVDALLKSDAIKELSQTSGIEKTQLLNMVQEELPGILKQYKIGAEDPFKAAARIREVRKAAARARSEAEAAEQLVKAQAERASAMQALADITGRPLKPGGLTPAKLAEHERLVGAYVESAKEFRAITERGLKAAEQIELGTANARDMRGLQAQLRDAVREIKKYDDEFRTDPHGRKGLSRRGLVGKHFDNLTAFRGEGDPTAPSFVDSSLQQVRYDERRIKSAITDMHRQIKATKLGDPLRPGLKDQLFKLEHARRGLVYERALLDEGRTIMRPYARKNYERIARSVTPQRVAPHASNPTQLRFEIGRDLMRSLHDVAVRDAIALPEKYVESIGRLRVALSNVADTIAAELGDDGAKLVERALGRVPTREDWWTVMRLARMDPEWGARIGRASKAMDTEVVILARKEGFTFAGQRVDEAADWIWDVIRDSHSQSGLDDVPGMADYARLDEKVQSALVEWRQFEAEGQIRLRERRFRPPSEAVDAVFHDTDLYENLVKMRVLEEEGMSIFAYDELRGVLRRPLTRERSAVGIAKRALERAAREGIDIEEALLAERAATAKTEALRNVEEFATRPELQGMPPETRLRAFEEKMLMDDLPEAPKYQHSPYQDAALRRAFREKTGFDFDDKHMIARYYRGELVELPEGARLPKSGEFMVFDDADGINVWVVPRDHKALNDGIPFGRPRGGEDELASLFEETQRLAHNWDLGGDEAFKVGKGESFDKETQKLLDDLDVDVPDIDLDLAQPKIAWEDGVIPENHASKRGADTGRRPNPNQERIAGKRHHAFQGGSGAHSGPVRKSLKKSYGWHENAAPAGWETNPSFVEMPIELAGELGSSPEAYRRWLWDQMVSDPQVRRRLSALREKQIVHSNGIKAQILADAIEWMKTPAADAKFSSANLHPASLGHLGTQPGTRAQLKMQLAQAVEAHRVARQLAGYEPEVVSGSWRAARKGDLVQDGIINEAGEFVPTRVQRWTGRSWETTRDEVPDRLDLPRSIDLEGRTPRGRTDAVFEISPASDVRWNRVHESSANDVWEQRMLAFERQIVSLERQLKGSSKRARGQVGLSVTGDGIYIAEGTSNVTVAHEMFHQFWDDPFNALWRTDIEDAINLLPTSVRDDLWDKIRVGSTAPFEDAEFAAELYALWRVGDSAGSDVLYGWRDLLDGLGAAERRGLEHVAETFESGSPKVVDHVRQQLNFPPTKHRGRLLKWFEERGHFSPRTGEAIRSGERVWSVEDERRLYMGMLGLEADWLDEAALKVILNDPRLHNATLRAWGYFDDDFEEMIGAADLSPSELQDAIVWGREGLQRQRTAAELREWSIQRYGKLVSQDGKTLDRMPWLMRADDEYLRWTSNFFDEATDVAQRPALEAARDKLPEVVRDHLFDGDALRSLGMEIDPRLVKAKELQKLKAAIHSATKRRLERMIKAGDVQPGEWLAQEQLRFAYDVTDQLLVDPVWRGFLRGKPVAGLVLHVWGQFWRMLVSWQPAFPVMNLLETYGFKRLYLTVYEGGLRPLSIEADGRRIIKSLRHINAESASIFGLEGGSPWVKAGNQYLTAAQRGSAVAQGIRELPLHISAFGEDALRLDFARRVAGDTFRSARKTGMSAENAEWLARHEAKRMVESFFAISGGAGWQTALNEVVPFFSYNFKNKTLAFKMLWQHPSVYAWGERIQRHVEAMNREQWAKDHPDLPFPEGPSASWLWWKVGDDYYKIDLSAFSDWTRALSQVTRDYTALQWFNEFIRVPHPSQLGALAIFTGEDTPWGNPGHIREMSIWADLFYYAQGVDYTDPRKRRDLIQIWSQILFFKKFGKIGTMDVKQSTFFALRDLDPALGREYLEANPDLQLYWDSFEGSGRIKGFDPMIRQHYRTLLSDQQNTEYNEAKDGLDALMNRLDARIAKYAAVPWSEEYKAAKKESYVLRTAYLKANPILSQVWGGFMTASEFAEERHDMILDELQDAWFNWKRPQASSFETDLAYNEALVAYNERRATFLEAHPALQAKLEEGRTAIETAWKQQELHWTELLDFQARIKIRQLTEEAKGDDADYDLIDLLYRAKDFAGAELDADRFGAFESPGNVPGSFFSSLPGFADFRYARASAEEREQMDLDQWYGRAIKGIKADSGKEFYEKLAADPKLMAEYFRRNPDKEAKYYADQEYVGWMGRWAGNLKVRNFDAAQQVWDSMPAWVRQRYLDTHPDSKMHDGAGGGTAVEYKGQWFKSAESRDRYIMFVENGNTAVEYEGKWFKSAESRDRYIRWIEGGGTGASPEAFAEIATQTFRSAESRQRYLDGQAYYAAISRWVELLKAKDYVAADKAFKAMPAWMRDKYYKKHPDQRAKAEIDSEALRHGAEYFLASGDDKLKILQRYPSLREWLKENGGDEGAMRGLVAAVYRAIPSSEPWLKRTFRERFPEIFGQEAAGERRLASVARELAEHPEMLPFYEKALALQTKLYIEQLKLNKKAPKPWTMERKKRAVRNGKRRAARMASHWTLHRDIRRYG